MTAIGLIASHSKDYIHYPHIGSPVIEVGGPAHFISSYWNQHHVRFTLIATAHLEIDIVRSGDDEYGSWRNLPLPKNIPDVDLPSVVVWSTIYNELSPPSITEDTQLWIDVQNFARILEKDGALPLESKVFIRSAYFLKGTEKEIELLSKANVFHAKQYICMTSGKRGSILLHGSERSRFPVETMIQARNTVGAGDTFLGACVTYHAKGHSIQKSISLAQEDASLFLQRK